MAGLGLVYVSEVLQFSAFSHVNLQLTFQLFDLANVHWGHLFYFFLYPLGSFPHHNSLLLLVHSETVEDVELLEIQIRD